MSWLRFDEVKDTGKTKVWNIYNLDNGSYLGQVKWRGAWRQYVYDSACGIVWNPPCMRELIDFIEERMAERRK